MKILVIDGQGGGLGRQLVAAISAACPEARLTAVGTNSLATSAMLKAGTVRAATGENAVVVNCRIADIIVGPIGIVMADALLGGATYSTADTVRPALQLVKTKKGAHLVSSCFILDRDFGEEGLKRIAMGDCAVNIDYTDTVDKATGEVKIAASAKLAEVAVETAKTAKLFGIDPKVAVLSFSTKGSGKGGTVALSHDATIKAQEMDPELAVDGELQFDAAVSPTVGQLKFPGSPVAGHANTFIFPCIEAGNIGYKIAQRLGGFAAYGPILQGLNAPINDLSRGCDAEEVYQMSIITAALA